MVRRRICDSSSGIEMHLDYKFGRKLILLCTKGGSITHKKSELKDLDYMGALLDRYNLAREKDNAVLKVWSLKKAAYELYKLGEYAHSSLKYKQNYSAYKKTFARLLRYELFHVNGGLSIAEKIWITVRFLFPGAIRTILSFLENRKQVDKIK